MNNPDDNDARIRALDPQSSFIVQAPAGSGKTELLIRRFLNLLGRVDAPEEVVAITFTKKAAAEMRERVMSALALGQKPKPVASENELALWELAHRAWTNNQKRAWQLHRHPARLRVQTIDALCATLTRQMPWLSGFGAPLQVVEDADELYRDAAMDTVKLLGGKRNEWRGGVIALLKHLDNQIPRAVELLTDALRYRDQWLRHLGHDNDSPEQKRSVLELAWTGIIKSELGSALKTIPHGTREDLLGCARFAANQLVANDRQSDINVWCGRSEFVSDDPRDLALWRGLCELLLRKDGHWRAQVNVRNGFPAGKSPQAVEMKSRIQRLLSALSGDEVLRESLLRVRRLPDVRFSEKQWAVLAALIRLLPLAAARLHLVFAERGEIDFSEINIRANHALGNLDSPSDLALRLDYQISHLLVDEFQDTSLTQFELLRNLTAGWSEGDGRTLFLVGDPMQSIYRFREAEVGLFLRVQQYGMGMVALQPLTLSVNFRSDPEVVDWINQTFGQTFPAQPDINRGAVNFNPSEAFLPSVRGSGVNIHGFVDTPERTESERVVTIIEQALSTNKHENVAVLVRSRTALLDLLPALDRAGLAYSGLDIEGLNWQPVVQDLLSLTKALLFPADRMAWLAVLRAPWCGLTLNDLCALTACSGDGCVWENIQKVLHNDGPSNNMSADGRRRLQRLEEILRPVLDNRERIGVRRWIENAWMELGGAVCINPHHQQNVRTFFDLLEDFDRRTGIEDFAGFQRAVAQRWAQRSNTIDHRLQIMTLHKAKGLEFDTVIIPGLHRRLRLEDTKLLLWEERVAQADDALLLAPLAETGPGRDLHYDYLRRQHNDKENFEVLRLLYVGCTRARRRLHLLGTLNTDDAGNLKRPAAQSLLAKLWPQVCEHFEQAKVRQLELFQHDPIEPTRLMLKRLPDNWRPAELPGAIPVERTVAPGESDEYIEFSWVGESARHVGVVVHDMLELIADQGLQKWSKQRVERLVPRWRSDYARLGIPAEEIDLAVTRTRQALLNTLQDERAHWLFERLNAQSEFPVSVSEKGRVRHLRIDRTFVDAGGVRWIIDFKTSAHEGGKLDEFLDREHQRYRPQLESYAVAMAAMDSRPIKLGLYFPLLKGWREWDFSG